MITTTPLCSPDGSADDAGIKSPAVPLPPRVAPLTAMIRVFIGAVCSVVLWRMPLSAQVQSDSMLHYARQTGIAAANRTPAWPFALLGVAAGLPIGAAVGDLPNTRVGDEAGYRTRRVAVGVTLLIGSSIVAREAFTRLDDPGLGSPAEFAAAETAYVARLRRRRTNALLFGAGIGAALGFAVYAYAPTR